MDELVILGLISLCGLFVCIKYLLYKCKDTEYINQTIEQDNDEEVEEVPPKYEDIN